MRLEYIDRIGENDVIAKNVLTEDGRILLRAGVKLTKVYIDKLKSLGVYSLYIEDERLDDIPKEDEKVAILKQTAMKNLSALTRWIQSSNKARIKESISTLQELIEYITEFGDVSSNIYDVKTYDNYTYVHCIDTGIMSVFLGLSMKLSKYNLRKLGTGALLHDIGKTKIPISIIGKKGALTNEEYEIVKKHPIYGAEIIKKNVFLYEYLLDIVLQHHERVDGKGYPYGLVGCQISDNSKIVSICDVYDALRGDRCYRKKMAPNEAYELILGGSGTMFDEKAVMKFKETFSIYPLGCCIKLSNGVEGYVIKQNDGFPDRPIIRVLYDSETRKSIPFYEIDLLKNLNLVVQKAI